VIEPVVEVSESGQLTSLKIRQGMGLRGKNRLRLQKLNVGVFAAGEGASPEPFVIEDVVISPTEECTTVDLSKLPAEYKFGAVTLNLNEHAYAKVRFDAQSIDWLTENLHTVADPLTRAAVWRYFWMLVMDRKMSSLKYLEFVQKQLPHETIDIIIDVALMNLRLLISSYIPTELIKEKKDVMFGTLVALLAKEGIQKDPIVD